MARKRIRVSRRMLLTWFMLGGFILLFTPQRLTNKFQFAFTHAFSWPLGISRSITLVARTPTQTELVSRKEYEHLQILLANVIEQRDQLHKMVEKLSGLRVIPDWQRMNNATVLADIITASDGLQNQLIINRGAEDGLAKGQFVLGDKSIIGRVSDVSAHRAKVTLITDSTSKIPAKIARLNVDGLMEGTGSNSAKIPLIRRSYKIKIGDIVYARKEPGLLDVSIITGKVAVCETDNENPLLWDITVKPACDIEGLTDVAVIVMSAR